MLYWKNKKSAARKESFGKERKEFHSFEDIERYYRKKDFSTSFEALTDRTCSDLYLNNLFIQIDRTTSRPGQQFLYYTLRNIPENNRRIELREETINTLNENPDLRLSLIKNLNLLRRREAYNLPSLFLDNHIEKPRWFFVIPLLAAATFVSLILMIFISRFFLLFFGLFIINLGIHYWNKKNLAIYLWSLPQMLLLLRASEGLFKQSLFKNLNPNLNQSLYSLGKIRKSMSFFRLEAGLQGDLASILWVFLELIKICFLAEPLLFFGLLKKLDSRRTDQEALFLFVGEADLCLSLCSLRRELPYFCLPRITRKTSLIEAEEMYHPLIRNCVSNSINTEEKSVLLTGSNMSGKTSFIRTLGINAVTGLTLNTCFAKSFVLPRVGISTAIRISDDLLNDKSYYFEEVMTILDMIQAGKSGKKHLLLLDEIYKGTNTIERISAGKAVLSYLADSGNIVFVSTHDIELADLLSAEYSLYHFSERVNDKSVDFDYKLKKGKLTNRNAIKILAINNYPESVISEAIKISKSLSKYPVEQGKKKNPVIIGKGAAHD